MLSELIKANPLPFFLAPLWLTIRWRTWVHPRSNIYYPFSIRFGPGGKIYGPVTLIANGGPLEIGSSAELYDGGFFHVQKGSITVGANCSFGPYVTVFGGGGVVIGNGCRIANHTMIVSSSHAYKDRARTIIEQGSILAPVKIGDDVWLGGHSSILYGVEIGTGAVVGANSVVRENVPPYTVVAGIPAKIIGER